MKHRMTVRAAIRNAQAIQWVKTHTLQDLEDLVNEMSDLGEDVKDISQLLNDLYEMDWSLHADVSSQVPEPEVRESAAIAAG